MMPEPLAGIFLIHPSMVVLMRDAMAATFSVVSALRLPALMPDLTV